MIPDKANYNYKSINNISDVLNSPKFNKTEKQLYRNAIKSLSRNERTTLSSALEKDGKITDDAAHQIFTHINDKVSEQKTNKNNKNYSPLPGRLKGPGRSIARAIKNISDLSPRIGTKKLENQLKNYDLQGNFILPGFQDLQNRLSKAKNESLKVNFEFNGVTYRSMERNSEDVLTLHGKSNEALKISHSHGHMSGKLMTKADDGDYTTQDISSADLQKLIKGLQEAPKKK